MGPYQEISIFVNLTKLSLGALCLLQALRSALRFPKWFQVITDSQTSLPMKLFTIILRALPALLCRIKSHFLSFQVICLWFHPTGESLRPASIQKPCLIPFWLLLFYLWILCMGWECKMSVIIKIIGTIFPYFRTSCKISAKFQRIVLTNEFF